MRDPHSSDADGSDDEFGRLVTARSLALRRTAYLMCGDWFEAEDLVQQAFIKVHAAWGRIRRRDDLDAYLRKTLLRTCTGEFVMDNGCNPDHSIFGLAAGRAVSYNGSLPDGTAVTGFEGEYRLPAGTGARTMQDARTYGRGGCDPGPGGGFSQDTVTALPSGIGDDAFVQNQPQQGTVRVTVRIGDTILQTDIVRADHGRPALTSDADRAWLQRIAVGMAARYTGSAKHG